MDPIAFKFLGAGLACIGMGLAAMGVGNIFGNFLSGALRNPSAADGQFARAFIGSIHNYSMSRLLVGEHAIPEGMFVRGLIDLLLRGALPEVSATRTLSTRRERR